MRARNYDQTWLGASKAIRPDGSPIPMFHGSRYFRQIGRFSGSTIWFAETPGLANLYCGSPVNGFDEQSVLYKVFLRVLNPLDVVKLGIASDCYVNEAEFLSAVGLLYLAKDQGDRSVKVHILLREKKFVEAAKAAGFDGLRVLEADASNDGGKNTVTWAVFDSENVCSAIGNHAVFANCDNE
jgi:hypothetical protein